MTRNMADFLRILVLLALTAALLWLRDEANLVVIDAALIGVFLVGVSHVTRRILFHRLDLQSIATTAIRDRNWPAAAVFLGIVYFLTQVMTSSMQVFK